MLIKMLNKERDDIVNVANVTVILRGDGILDWHVLFVWRVGRQYDSYNDCT